MMKIFLESLTQPTEEDEKKYSLGYGEPKDVSNAAIYLLSDAGQWITVALS